jgi:hypothetical protein
MSLYALQKALMDKVLPPDTTTTTADTITTTSRDTSRRDEHDADYDPLRVGPPRMPGPLPLPGMGPVPDGSPGTLCSLKCLQLCKRISKHACGAVDAGLTAVSLSQAASACCDICTASCNTQLQLWHSPQLLLLNADLYTAAYCLLLLLLHYIKGFGGEQRGDFSGDLMPGVGGGFPGSGGSLMGPDHPMFGGPSGMGYPQVSSVVLVTSCSVIASIMVCVFVCSVTCSFALAMRL